MSSDRLPILRLEAAVEAVSRLVHEQPPICAVVIVFDHGVLWGDIDGVHFLVHGSHIDRRQG